MLIENRHFKHTSDIFHLMTRKYKSSRVVRKHALFCKIKEIFIHTTGLARLPVFPVIPVKTANSSCIFGTGGILYFHKNLLYFLYVPIPRLVPPIFLPVSPIFPLQNSCNSCIFESKSPCQACIQSKHAN